MATSVEEYLTQLHADGWRVAVRQDLPSGQVSWLFVHPCGRWVRGEGLIDSEALWSVRVQAGRALAAAAAGCFACKVEADIGTEENPHPIPREHHTCRHLPARPPPEPPAPPREERLRALGFSEERPPDSVGALIGLAPAPAEPAEPVRRHFAVYGSATGEQIGCAYGGTQAEAEAEIHREEPRATLKAMAEAECPVCKEFGDDA